MKSRFTQKEKALQLHQAHQSDKLLMLPNCWDVLSAKLVESIDFPVIATASASIALTNGYCDGENLPFNDLLVLLEKISSSVNLPVTADIESGYSNSSEQLKENSKLILKTGIVGINLEDTEKSSSSLYSIEAQCERISVVRKVADEMDIPLFINARSDVYLYNNEFSTLESKQEELIKRGLAYKKAGANCFFPIAIRQEEYIQDLVKQLQMPINVLALPGIPAFKTLDKIGVKRVSLGPAFLKIAIKSMKNLALDLKNYEGLSTITENDVTSDYLKELIES